MDAGEKCGFAFNEDIERDFENILINTRVQQIGVLTKIRKLQPKSHKSVYAVHKANGKKRELAMTAV